MPDTVRTAQTFLERLFAGEYARATESFAPNMRAAVTDASLAKLWERIGTLFGKPIRHSGTRTAKTISSTVEIIYLSWDFERERLDTRVVVDSSNQIAGISFETPVIK